VPDCTRMFQRASCVLSDATSTSMMRLVAASRLALLTVSSSVAKPRRSVPPRSRPASPPRLNRGGDLADRELRQTRYAAGGEHSHAGTGAVNVTCRQLNLRARALIFRGDDVVGRSSKELHSVERFVRDGRELRLQFVELLVVVEQIGRVLGGSW